MSIIRFNAFDLVYEPVKSLWQSLTSVNYWGKTMGSGNKDWQKDSPWLTGKMLIAMPSMQDPRFARTVTFMCQHGPEGAMGLVVNRLYGDINFHSLLQQLNIKVDEGTRELPVHFGGPVDPVRGFVLHSTDYAQESTLKISDTIAMTATVEILKELSEGKGPSRAILALGYAGWGAGQLDAEMQTTGWLVAPADEDIIFDNGTGDKWERALAKLGVSPSLLSGYVGHA